MGLVDAEGDGVLSGARPMSFLLEQRRDAVLKAFRAPVARELAATADVVRDFYDSQSHLLTQTAAHLDGTPGKRVRPTLLLLVAAMGRPLDSTAVMAAAMLELVHTATLIHDDSIDRSLVRRGLPTINALWDDKVSVILGDYLYTKAFERLVAEKLWKPVAILSRCAYRMSLGELLAMEQKDDMGLEEGAYFEYISAKTASLISAACEIGAAIGFDDDDTHERFRLFGHELGMAYQITDDLFDYTGDAAALGKDVGSDLKEGKITLPIIRALRHASPDLRALIHDVLADRTMSAERWQRLKVHLDESGSIAYCADLAREYADRALSRLEPCVASPHKDALTLAVSFAVQRSH